MHVLGEYVQADEDRMTRNNNAPYSLESLYLRPAKNHQGRHNVLHLQTNTVINRLVTPSIIKLLHEIAITYQMPKGSKINSRNRYSTI